MGLLNRFVKGPYTPSVDAAQEAEDGGIILAEKDNAQVEGDGHHHLDANGKTEDGHKETDNGVSNKHSNKSNKKKGLFGMLKRNKSSSSNVGEKQQVKKKQKWFVSPGAAMKALNEKRKAIGDTIAKKIEGSKLNTALTSITKAVKLDNLFQAGKNLKKKVGEAASKAKAKLFGGETAEMRAQQRARLERIEHAIKDLTHEAFTLARGAVLRAEAKTAKALKEREEKMRLLAEARRLRLEKERLLREATAKAIKNICDSLWAELHHHAMTKGVALVIAKRKYEEYLRLRRERVLARFTLFGRKLHIRQHATRLSTLILKRIVVEDIFNLHERRQASSLVIQCQYRMLQARRELLMLYILEENRLYRDGKQLVLEKWKARLQRAYNRIKTVETEAHRQLRRRIWARTEYSAEISRQHYLGIGLTLHKEPEPPTIQSFAKRYDGTVALKLPNTNTESIIAPISEDSPETNKLNWIGVPIAAGLNPNQQPGRKNHYKLIYQPVPAQLLGVSLKDNRDRKQAQEILGSLQDQAKAHHENLVRVHQELLQKQNQQDVDDFHAREKRELWDNVESLI